MTAFIDVLKPYLRRSMKILDLGAGALRQSAQLAELGYNVTALDTKRPSGPIPESVRFVLGDMHSFYEPTDVVFMHFSAHILEKNYFKKEFVPRFQDAALIAIRTFTEQPEPPFGKNVSVFSKQDFIDLGRKIEVLNTWDEVSVGLDGIERKWHMIDYIGSKT